MQLIHHRQTRAAAVRGRLVALGMACLVMRALIPAGYMPGNLLDGEFMVLCPAGMSPSLLSAAGNAHEGHEQDFLDVDRDCPIGSALQFAWMPMELNDSRSEMGLPVFAGATRDRTVITPAVRYYHSRAPPQA
jgi:hypothetical protein